MQAHKTHTLSSMSHFCIQYVVFTRHYGIFSDSLRLLFWGFLMHRGAQAFSIFISCFLPVLSLCIVWTTFDVCNINISSYIHAKDRVRFLNMWFTRALWQMVVVLLTRTQTRPSAWRGKLVLKGGFNPPQTSYCFFKQKLFLIIWYEFVKQKTFVIFLVHFEIWMTWQWKWQHRSCCSLAFSRVEKLTITADTKQRAAFSPRCKKSFLEM